jgi:hypothetical protein
MSKHYLHCWQGHPAGFIVESTMQHCCLLASQWFSHHAKTPCVSGLPLQMKKIAESTKNSTGENTMHRVSGLPLQMKKTAESTKNSTGGNTMHPSPF